jgi:hypothetical protein
MNTSQAYCMTPKLIDIAQTFDMTCFYSYLFVIDCVLLKCLAQNCTLRNMVLMCHLRFFVLLKYLADQQNGGSCP